MEQGAMTAKSDVMESVLRHSQDCFGKSKDREGGIHQPGHPGWGSPSTNRPWLQMTMAADHETLDVGRWFGRGIPELASPLSD
jgi:hypothetical protein